MKPEIKKLWVEALRSGKYEQGTGRLRNGDKFCCLGVLCDVAMQTGLPLAVTYEQPDQPSLTYYDGMPGLLPLTVRRWADIDSSLGGLPNTAPYRNLAEANDDGETFGAIANLIERYF